MLETINLTKKYEDGHLAVDHLSFKVEPGEIFCMFGANGAGKTTTINLFLNFIPPTEGTALIEGIDVTKEPLRSKDFVSFVSENVMLYGNFTARQNLDFFAKLGGKPDLTKEQYYQVMRRVSLQEKAFEQRVKNFSKGMLQRIGLAQALLNEPDLIFLDEPTSGLDPVGRRLVRDIIRAERERGATILLNSHLLGEVEITCDRVAFIKEGEVVETRELHDEREEQTTVSIRAAKITSEALNGLSQWSSTVRPEGERLTITISSISLLPEVVRYLVAKGADVYEVTPRRLSLEERFLEIVGTDGGL